MPCRTIEYDSAKDWPSVRDWLSGRENPGQSVDAKVADIIADVAERGDEALADYGRRFDCETLSANSLSVTGDEVEEAVAQIPPEDLDILAQAATNIRDFHEGQVQRSWWTTREDGTILGQMVTPVQRVGLYVPGGQGGQTPLVSSVLMNAVPAQVAGVEELVMTSPPRPDGTLNPYLLATAHLLGIDEIHKAGSAWGVAALALGTESIRPVDVLAGPGNIFVATAKRLLTGKVGTDMIAGPSEIAVLADDSANPDWVAADMLSQAEHDPLASSLMVTNSSDLARAVAQAVKAQLADLPRADIAAKSLKDWGAMVIVPDLAAGIDFINRLAPEHLELALADPWSVLGRIKNAGAVFMGHHNAEPVGDYFAGPNHVLPTNGTARFSSALGVDTFVKKSSVIAASPAFVAANADKIARLARLEGLEAHARSVEQRLTKS